MPSDGSLPIIDLTYRLVLEVDRAVGDSPRSQRPGLERGGVAAAFEVRCHAPARYEELSRTEREVGRLLGGRRKSAPPPAA